MTSLRDIVAQTPYIKNANVKILIDNEVKTDEAGNYIVHVGYTRVSTDAQAEYGFGLEVQEEEILKYAKNKGLENLLLFIDDGYTGTNFNRPSISAIMRLIETYNQKKSNVRIRSFLIARFDRLGRTLLDSRKFLEDYIVSKAFSHSEINENKESLHFSVTEGGFTIDENNLSDLFTFNIFMSVAEHERNTLVKKMKDGMIARVKSGQWPGGGNDPYGYHYDPIRHELVVVPEEAAKIKEIFRLYIEENKSPQWIADNLGFKSDVVVSQILKRKSLTGIILYKGVEYKGNHEPIIDLARWEEAQRVRDSRSTNRGASDNLLKGLVVCGECGAKMRYQQWNKRTKEKKLVCYSSQGSTKPQLIKDPNCQNERYWAEDVENAVIETLLTFSYLEDKNEKKVDVLSIHQSDIEEKIKGVKRKISKLVEAIVDLEDDDDFMRDEMNKKKKALNAELKSLIKQREDEEIHAKLQRQVEEAKAILRDLKHTWDFMSPQEKQQVCSELIEKVVVYKNYKVEVHLKMKSYLSYDASEQEA